MQPRGMSRFGKDFSLELKCEPSAAAELEAFVAEVFPGALKVEVYQVLLVVVRCLPFAVS